MKYSQQSLNPCFSGLYYLTRKKLKSLKKVTLSLNPCFSGLYYLTIRIFLLQVVFRGLNPCFSGLYYLTV